MMKTTSVKGILAVVLSLLMLLGSGGVAEAKETGRYLNVNFVNAHWDLSGGGMNFVLPSASFSYNNLQVFGYEYQWYTRSSEYDVAWEIWGNTVTVNFGQREKSGFDIPLPIPSSDWPYSFGGHAMITMYLIDHKGDYLHGYGPPEPDPMMNWHLTVASLTFDFLAYEAAGYVYQWYYDGNTLGETQYIWFGEIRTNATALPVVDYRGSGGSYTVEVWLIKSNGHKIPGAYLYAGFTSF